MTASRAELLQSIRPDMRLDKNIFLRIYGYSMTEPEFAEKALTRMQILGCGNARNYYSCIVAENEAEYRKQMKEAAEWYSKRLEERWDSEHRKGGDRRWRENRASLLQRKKELLMLRSQGLTRN